MVNFVADTFSNLAAGSYQLSVRDANGCTIQTNSVAINNPLPPTALNFNNTLAQCPSNTSTLNALVTGGTAPYSFNIVAPITQAANSVNNDTGTFNNITPGTYTVRVTDANAVLSGTYTIADIIPLALNSTTTPLWR